jgi:hypothetical protein
MTEQEEADHSKATSEPNAPKSRSPSKNKAAATSSEAPAKTSRKRRKVNHGKSLMLCILICLHSPTNWSCQCSMHLLQAFGEPQPSLQRSIHGILLHVRRLLLIADLTPIAYDL